MSGVVDVAAGLVFRDGKLLIARRFDDVHLGGLWEFPGGKREPEETFEACLARELREELGIEVLVGPRIEMVTHEYPEKTVHLQFFRCAWQRNEPQALGCTEFAWVTASALDAYEFPAADESLLEKLKTDPSLWRNGRE
jgi:8-oxo-dGTP diphosphatase